jgi:hypothetical protein
MWWVLRNMGGKYVWSVYAGPFTTKEGADSSIRELASRYKGTKLFLAKGEYAIELSSDPFVITDLTKE